MDNALLGHRLRSNRASSTVTFEILAASTTIRVPATSPRGPRPVGPHPQSRQRRDPDGDSVTCAAWIPRCQKGLGDREGHVD